MIFCRAGTEPELVEVQEVSVISGAASQSGFKSLPPSSLGFPPMMMRVQPQEKKFAAVSAAGACATGAATGANRRKTSSVENVFSNNNTSTSSSLDQLRQFLSNRSPSRDSSSSSRMMHQSGFSRPLLNSNNNNNNINAPPSRRILELRALFTNNKNKSEQPPSRNRGSNCNSPDSPATAAPLAGLLGMLHSIGVFADAGDDHAGAANAAFPSSKRAEDWQRLHRREATRNFQERQRALLASRAAKREQFATAEEMRRQPTSSYGSSRSLSPAPSLPPHRLRPASTMHYQQQRPRCSSAPTISSQLRIQRFAQLPAAASMTKQRRDPSRCSVMTMIPSLNTIPSSSGGGGVDNNNQRFTPRITPLAEQRPARGCDSMFKDQQHRQQRQEQLRAASLKREAALLPFHPSAAMPESSRRRNSLSPPSALSNPDAYLRQVAEREAQLQQIRSEAAVQRAAAELQECTFKPATRKLPAFVQRLLRK